MSDPFWLYDAQCARLQPLLPTNGAACSASTTDGRRPTFDQWHHPRAAVELPVS